MDFYIKIRQRVMDLWLSKDKAQKTKIIIAAITAITALSVIIFFTTRPKYTTLFSNLDIKEAGEIAKKLDDMKVSYKLDDGGQTILVDPEEKYKARINLAQEGLPKGGSPGFDEIFSKSKLGTTEWERQIQYNQALQGELTKAVEKMAAVESAKIYIVQQEKSIFVDVDKKNEPSAAVFLEIKPGANIGKEEVTGIINLITYSVKGMKPENITVVDEFGRTLSNIPLSSEGDNQELINNQLTIQNNFQYQLQTNVQSLLEQIFGLGNVAVRVSAQLNFDTKTVQNKFFTPTNEETGEGIVRSIQELKEHFSGGGAVPGGVPGVDSNIPGYEQVLTGDSEHQRTEIIKNFDINETHENLTVAPGAVNKLTVSVVINRELNETEKNSIAQVVGNAIGYTPERDQISIEGMEFNNDLSTFFADEMTRQQKERAKSRYFAVGGVILLAIIIFSVMKGLGSRKRQRAEEERLSQELFEMQQAAATQVSIENLEDIKSDVYDKLEKYSRRKPEDVAKVLKTWLSEE
jgi:flagellar M-ring protein FliF